MKTLTDLYTIHSGKVSDKWLLYLREYDRLLAPYREQVISLLEIGVQNGGSLEIWSRYFANGTKFVGCDINPDCAKLRFDDPRITVITGDATSPVTQAEVLEHSANFDLIIDDGSHTSGDIVKAFARYFPALKTGGLFVAEDLHCSYWQEYQGGIFYPYSSMSFFKHLADVVNHEHWGVDASRTQLLNGFSEQYQINIQELELQKISSIEFINSMCIIRKSDSAVNTLSSRVITGQDESILSGLSRINGSMSHAPDQQSNTWSNLNSSPAENQRRIINENKELIQKLLVSAKEIENYRLRIQSLQSENESIRRSWQAEKVAHRILRQSSQSDQTLIRDLRQEILALRNSMSWRSTSLLRAAGLIFLPALRILDRTRQASLEVGGFKNLVGGVLRIARQEGLQGLRTRLSTALAKPSVITESGHPVDRNDYQAWIKLYDTLDQNAKARIKDEIAHFDNPPKISVVMPVYNAPLEFLKQAIESVQSQLYPHWELCIADDASTDKRIGLLLKDFTQKDPRIKVVFRTENGHISAASNSALALATGDFVALLDNDDLLAQHALYHVAKTIQSHPEAVLIYSDEDKITTDGQRYGPYFKCKFNYELMLAQNMISHLGVFRRSTLQTLGGFRIGFEGSQDYDLALRVIETAGHEKIVHIPRVLYHWRAIPGSTATDPCEKNYAFEAAREAIKEHLVRSGRGGAVTPSQEISTFSRIRYPLPEIIPLISIVIPTRDRADLLEICLESVLSQTTYPHFEIIVVDNGSVEPQTQQLLGRQPVDKVRVIRDDSAFNYSRLNNMAVQQTKGQVICLMNNDIEVLTPDWIEEMISFAMQADIGCVGARLWYPDGRLQHGGVILGLGGVAGHSHKYLQKGHHGYFGRAQLHQSISAITGACLMVRRDIWNKVNGLNEKFAVAFNDVDFCLRVRELGYRNIWTPYAEMCHHESASRGNEDSPEKIERFNAEIKLMKEIWGPCLLTDPAYSPNLTLDREDFSLAWPPINTLH
jgi:glycosyltransferase involved in cell wall biosynthesis